jgi:hypothetical protein
MNTRPILRELTGAVLILMSVAGCGSQPERPRETAPQRSSSSAVPDALLADAMRRHNQDPAQSLALVAEAAAKAPNRPDVLWLYAQLCARATGCQPEEAESRLRKIDPDNAAAWLGAFARAHARRDLAAQNEILDAMSREARFDIYWNSLVSKITRAVGPAPVPETSLTEPLTTTMNAVIGWLSGLALPSFAPLGDTCLKTTNPATIERCRGVAKALMQGDSMIAGGMGISIMERVAQPASEEAMAMVTHRTRSTYQLETAGAIVSAQVEQDRFTREMLELMSTLRREQDVYIAIIRWAGKPLEPQ